MEPILGITFHIRNRDVFARSQYFSIFNNRNQRSGEYWPFSSVIGGTPTQTCDLKWLYNIIVSEGKCCVFGDSVFSEMLHSRRSVLQLCLVLKLDGRDYIVFSLDLAEREHWHHMMGLYVFLVRLHSEESLARGIVDTCGIPDEILHFNERNVFDTFVNRSDMFMLEQLYERCIVCGCKSNNTERSPIALVVCVKCITIDRSRVGIETLRSSSALITLEILKRRTVKWFCVDKWRFGDNLLACIMESKQIKVLVLIDLIGDKQYKFFEVVKRGAPFINSFAYYPRCREVSELFAISSHTDECVNRNSHGSTRMSWCDILNVYTTRDARNTINNALGRIFLKSIRNTINATVKCGCDGVSFPEITTTNIEIEMMVCAQDILKTINQDVQELPKSSTRSPVNTSDDSSPGSQGEEFMSCCSAQEDE